MLVTPYVPGMSEVCLYLWVSNQVCYIYPPQLWPPLHWGARQRLEMRLKKQRDACERGMTEKSPVVEHAQGNHHLIHWEETTVLDHDRGQELR